MDRVRVSILAADPVSRAGAVSLLGGRPELQLVDEDRAAVLVAVVDEVAGGVLRELRRAGVARIVLVAPEVTAAELVALAECGTVGVVRRAEASAERLAQAVLAAARGEGTLPADLLGQLLDQVGRRASPPAGGLAERETAVLRLVADGYDTAEIARALSYSERTVKNILHDVMLRLRLRNRSHAVAYALREGLI